MNVAPPPVGSAAGFGGRIEVESAVKSAVESGWGASSLTTCKPELKKMGEWRVYKIETSYPIFELGAPPHVHMSKYDMNLR